LTAYSALDWTKEQLDRQEAKRAARRASVGEKNEFVRMIEARFKRNTNSNIAVTGEPGLGKSSCSLRLGEILKPEIFVDKPAEAVDRFVTFSGGEFGRAIKNSPDGSVIIGDEFGQQMHHRNFATDPNKALSAVLQGFRFRRLITFMCAPSLNFFDIDAERLLTWMLNVRRQGIGEVYRVQHAKFKSHDYYKTEFDTFRFSMPRPELWKIYVEKKGVNQERVFDAAIKVMDQAEAVKLSDREIITEVLAKPGDFKIKGRISGALVKRRFEIGRNRADDIAKVVNQDQGGTDPSDPSP